MPGHASAIAPIVEGASVRVPATVSSKALQLLDGRPKMHWTEAEVEEAAKEQQQKAGPLVALVRDRIEATWSEIRRELNETAGGQASARVMVLAHHAMRAHQALELQSLLAEVDAGGNGRAKADPNNGLRNQSGLSVIASQALNQAYEAARAEGKANQGSLADQLMAKLGHGVSAKGQAMPPDAPPGEGEQRVPLHSFFSESHPTDAHRSSPSGDSE